MRTTSLIAIAAAATVLSTSANAADLGGNCCADLEERIAELEATTARKGNRKVKLTVSGQVGESIMWWDDGEESNVYVTTHDYARTRFRFVGDAKINDRWSAGYLLEIGVRAARGNRVDQNADDPATSTGLLDLRHSAWWIQDKDLGKVWVGQYSEAIDGITEINLSNAAGLGFIQVPDMFASGGGGWFFRNSNTGALSARRWGDLWIGGGSSGQPGEGDRYNLVRYDSPTIQGFQFSASWGEDDFWDVALRYANEFNGVKVAFGVGYSQWSDGNTPNERGCADLNNLTGFGGGSDVDCSTIGGSASVLHVPTGLYVAAAYGRKEDDNRDALFGVNVRDTDDFWHIQAGIDRKFFELGKTTIFGQYNNYDIGAGITQAGAIQAGFGDLGAARMANAEVDHFGFGIVQNIDKAAMDLYIYYGHVEADVNLSATGASAGAVRAPIEDFDFVLTGAVIKF